VNINNAELIKEIEEEILNSLINNIPIMQLEDFSKHITHVSENKSLIG
jgi:hypothetical protein